MDFNCEGLLLITNDGGLARTLELPKNNLQRVLFLLFSLLLIPIFNFRLIT